MSEERKTHTRGQSSCSYECKTHQTNQIDNLSLYPSAQLSPKQILSSDEMLSDELLSRAMLLLSRDPSNESESKQDELESIVKNEHKDVNTKKDKIDKIKVSDNDKSNDKIEVRLKTGHKIDSKSDTDKGLEVVNDLNTDMVDNKKLLPTREFDTKILEHPTNLSYTGARPKTRIEIKVNLPTMLSQSTIQQPRLH